MVHQIVYVSATPADYELEKSEGVVVEQLIRPTGLLDPPIEVRPCKNQVDDLIGEIRKTIEAGDRILVTTLTKRMAEELSRYLDRLRISCSYIHSEVKTLDRIEIIRNLREGVIDVLVGVNLLREGLDLPEVSLVAVMDADKEGFLAVQPFVDADGRPRSPKCGWARSDVCRQNHQFYGPNHRRDLEEARNARGLQQEAWHRTEAGEAFKEDGL